MEVDKPVQTVEVKRSMDVEAAPQRVRRRAKRSMDVDEPTGTKRPPPESVAEIKQKAARGDVIINNFPDYLKNSGWTVPMIKHQFIMHDVPFEPDATKKI